MTEPVKLNRRQTAKLLSANKLILAARKLWAEPGTYEAIGMRDIAAEAGLTTGAIFNSFTSKADLWRVAMGYEPPVDGYGVRQHLRAAATVPARAA